MIHSASPRAPADDSDYSTEFEKWGGGRLYNLQTDGQTYNMCENSY